MNTAFTGFRGKIQAPATIIIVDNISIYLHIPAKIYKYSL